MALTDIGFVVSVAFPWIMLNRPEDTVDDPACFYISNSTAFWRNLLVCPFKKVTWAKEIITMKLFFPQCV